MEASCPEQGQQPLPLQGPSPPSQQQHLQVLAAGQVNCWACGVLVQVPVVSGLLSPVFKCGWCGAISEAAPQVAANGGLWQRPGGGKRGSRSLMRRAGSCVLGCLNALKSVLVAVVVLMTGSIIIAGVAFVLPPLYGDSALGWLLHTTASWFFTATIFFNFFASVCNSAGTVHECCANLPPLGLAGAGAGEPGNPAAPCRATAEPAVTQPQPATAPAPAFHMAAGRSLVAQHAFRDYKYCWLCSAPKPPEAHHCSVCNRCVVDMDHHCPFVNNCVGRANMRSFLLFLVWAVAGVAYALACCGALMWRERAALHAAVARSWAAVPAKLTWRALARGAMIPFWMRLIREMDVGQVAVVYIACLSLGVFLGVGALLLQTASAIMRGTTYIEQLKGGKGARVHTGADANGAATPGGRCRRHGRSPCDPTDAAASARHPGDDCGGSGAAAPGAKRSWWGLLARRRGAREEPGPNAAHADEAAAARQRQQQLGLAGERPAAEERSWSAACARLQRVVGGPGVMPWVWPMWGPPEGVLVGPAAGGAKSKRL